MLASKLGKIIFNVSKSPFLYGGTFFLIPYFVPLCYTRNCKFFERGHPMKIHKTVNPVAYENTYYLEGDQHLIVVDPGSHWDAIRKTRFILQQPFGHWGS